MEGLVEIENIGLKPGEKLYEELYYGYEVKKDTPNRTIFSVSSGRRWENFEEDLSWFRSNMEQRKELMEKMLELVPEFTPSEISMKSG